MSAHVPESFDPTMTVGELQRTARLLGYERITLVVDRDGPHWHGVKAAAPSNEVVTWPLLSDSSARPTT